MMRLLQITFKTALIIAFLSLMVSGCGTEKQTAPDADSQASDQQSADQSQIEEITPEDEAELEKLYEAEAQEQINAQNAAVELDAIAKEIEADLTAE